MNKQEFLDYSLHTGLKGVCIYSKDESEIAILAAEDGRNMQCGINSWIGEQLYPIIPIARPLYDLTEPITHNGETFVPIDHLNDYIDWEHGYEKLEYWKIKKLIEWHFNLMNPSEEFIPVTETFNPYK